MEYDVTIDRDQYIGGSDIPAIMGISTFKTRWDLLQEKAGLKENTFTGNRYTEYGKVLEPKIREYVNQIECAEFEPNRMIIGDFRAHTDGYDESTVLEIKTTSHIYETVDEYKVYLVQLLKYMDVNNADEGILAVYERPEDFNTDFDKRRLRTYRIYASDYTELLNEINAELDRFRFDLKRLKENPLLSEQDFLQNDLVALSQKVVKFEQQLASIKAIEAECKKAKQELFEQMTKYDVKSWVTPNGTRITRVDSTPVKTEMVTEFDTESFKADNEGLYAMYCHEVEKKTNGKSGYVKITAPKG